MMAFNATILASSWLSRLFWYITTIRAGCMFVSLSPTNHIDLVLLPSPLYDAFSLLVIGLPISFLLAGGNKPTSILPDSLAEVLSSFLITVGILPPSPISAPSGGTWFTTNYYMFSNCALGIILHSEHGCTAAPCVQTDYIHSQIPQPHLWYFRNMNKAGHSQRQERVFSTIGFP